MTFLVRHSCDLRKEKQTLSVVPVLGKGHNFFEGEGAGGGTMSIKGILAQQKLTKNRTRGATGEKSSKCYQDFDFRLKQTIGHQKSQKENSCTR